MGLCHRKIQKKRKLKFPVNWGQFDVLHIVWSWWSSFTILRILWKQVVVSCDFLSSTYWWQDMNSHDTVKNETSKIRLPILWIFRSFKILTLGISSVSIQTFSNRWACSTFAKGEGLEIFYGGDSWHSWQLIINSGMSNCPFPCTLQFQHMSVK